MRRMKCGGALSMNASFLVASNEFVDGDGDFGDGRGQGRGSWQCNCTIRGP